MKNFLPNKAAIMNKLEVEGWNVSNSSVYLQIFRAPFHSL